MNLVGVVISHEYSCTTPILCRQYGSWCVLIDLINLFSVRSLPNGAHVDGLVNGTSEMVCSVPDTSNTGKHISVLLMVEIWASIYKIYINWK